MCGIFGATTLNKYESLYRKNKVRGHFSGGSLYVSTKGDMYLKKWKGIQDQEEITGEYVWSNEHTLYMGHTQAPTSSARAYNVMTTHPFEHGWFLVAHNGVLENHLDLRKTYLDSADGDCDGHTFNTLDSTMGHSLVDSAVLPALLDENYKSSSVKSDVQTIEDTFSLVEGTFACWVYSKHSRQSYLVRSGCTLFGDFINSSFSSVSVPEIAEQEIPEGVIYCITSEGLTEVGRFKNNSPFFLF